MKCPVCAVELKMADRQGIEVDYCPQCRGVWLDRGELDKIIERASHEVMPVPRAGDPRERHVGYHDGHRRKRRKSLLGELFDFD